ADPLQRFGPGRGLVVEIRVPRSAGTARSVAPRSARPAVALGENPPFVERSPPAVLVALRPSRCADGPGGHVHAARGRFAVHLDDRCVPGVPARLVGAGAVPGVTALAVPRAARRVSHRNVAVRAQTDPRSASAPGPRRGRELTPPRRPPVDRSRTGPLRVPEAGDPQVP